MKIVDYYQYRIVKSIIWGELIMEITHEYAQSIVEKTKSHLGKNINIMNSLGIIVGSKDKSRIDTFHQGAYEVIKTGKALEITLKQAEKLEGAKPGVNLPIFLNGKIVGVVGITGEPEEVRPFGQLLKISVETMLKQFYLSEQLRMEQNAKDLYIHDIINGNFQDKHMFLTKGEVLGFDMSIPRISLVIKVNESTNFESKKNLNKIVKLTANNVKNNFELTAQKKREKILDCIKRIFNNPQHMISRIGSNNYIILYALEKKYGEDIKRQLKEFAKALRKEAEKYSVKFCIGVGPYYPDLSGLRKSYKEAVKAIQIMDRISKAEELPLVVFASDLSLEMILSSIPEEIIENFKNQVISEETAEIFLNNDKLIETLKTYFESNLNISKTAKVLQITRNTVCARIEKIKDITGLDPSNFNDAVKLKILLTATNVK